jgi:acetyl esterase/lipase
VRLEIKLPIAAGLLFAIAAIRYGVAAEKVDLMRETPVPATQQIPIGDFFRPPLLQQPALNPSGTHIAAIITAGEDKHQLLVYELKTQKIETVGAPGDRDIFQATWLDDKRLVFQLSARKLYGVGLLAAEVGSLTNAYPLLQYYYSSVLSVPPKSRLRPLVWNRYDGTDNAPRHDLGVAVVNTDVKNGRVVDLLAASADMQSVDFVRNSNDRHILKTYPAPDSGLILRYITNVEGQLEFCVTGQNATTTLHRLTDQRWVPCPVNLEDIDLIDCGDRPGQLVVLGPRQEGKPRALQFMDGATGKLGEVLLQDKAYDFYSAGLSFGWLYRNPVSQQIIGAVSVHGGPSVVWFNEEYRTLQKILDGFFPGLVVRIIGSDQAQKSFLVATFSDRQPVIYNWVDLEKRTAGMVKRSAPWIERERMQPMNVIKFKTRDGLHLDAYLTLPAGASKQNPPPLVVLSHGGPWARDAWGFEGEVQFLASRGYAVLQPNYRGSNGYGWMYPKDDNWAFLKMHEDVTDATKAMIATKLIDPDRIAIMGGSFGGYLAVSGVVREPSLYRCAVTIAGVFDWEQQIRDKKYDQYDTGVFGYLMRKLGDPKKEAAKFEAMSPGRHVENIRVPVFVSGGKEDQTVEIEQSRTLISSLQKYHVPFESYIVAEEGHGMQHLDKQVELYARIEAFLARNLMAAKPAAVAAAGP